MLTKIITEDNIHKAKKLINRSHKIVIVVHTYPDGDALGSSLGLWHFLSELGKSVNVIVPDGYPSYYKWMPGSEGIIVADRQHKYAGELISSADLIFCLDFNELRRTAILEPFLRDSKAKKIMIDHHPDPVKFCDVIISHPEMSSTAELVFRFICRMGMFEYVNLFCAECIYTGMMTDTGAFTFNSNRPDIFFIISELLKTGIDRDAIYSRIYNRHSVDRVRLQGYVLYNKMKIYEKYHTSLIALSHEEHQRFNIQRGDTEGFVNIPLSMGDIIFSAFIREDKDVVKISLRSKDSFPCNRFAAEVYGGGGHLNASGGEFCGTLDEAIQKFEENLENYKELLVLNH
ncbi:MAG: bifunctional oligoribonuclease/PAP phosphatase NrnA [Dysgonamonadaceae bacterium]|jgi:phosphoesterase RecJ-like protein|nr:bifunctional oligoribonuclease/PAP phosphatase NrnA [Dysgonamonadaceae bacterium]